MDPSEMHNGKICVCRTFQCLPIVLCVEKGEFRWDHRHFQSVNFFSREDHADVDHLWGRNSDKCF